MYWVNTLMVRSTTTVLTGNLYLLLASKTQRLFMSLFYSKDSSLPMS